MSTKNELNRIAASVTGKSNNGGSKAPILKAIADTLEGDNLTGAWGNGEISIETVEMSGATLTADSVSGYADGIGRVFAFSFNITGTVSSSTSDANTVHFEATMPRDIPEGFSAAGIGNAHTTSGEGKILPCNVYIGRSDSGANVMDVHMAFFAAVPDGAYAFSGYVMAMLPIAE